MPSGIYPVPAFSFDTTPPSHRRTGLVARLRTRLRRHELDEQLARGADPGCSVELGVRADQLRSHTARAAIANALVEQLGDARGANLGAFRMRVRQQHAAIRETADDVLALVQRLRDERPAEIRGAAMAALLANDKRSALHSGGGQQLEDALRAARAALDPIDADRRSFATAA